MVTTEDSKKTKAQLLKELGEMRRQVNKLKVSTGSHGKQKEDEERFRVLYNSSPDMYASVSSNNGNILLCNETLLEKTGYVKEEIIGSPIFKMYHDDCLDEAKKAFQQFVETGEIRNRELILKRKDGSKIDVSLNVNAIKDDTGRILQSVSSWRDITTHKKVEKALIKSEARLRTAGMAAYDLLYEWDVSNDHLEWYSDIDGILGYKSGEISRNIKTWIALIHPEDATKLENAVELHRNSTKPIQYEYRIKHKDGTYRHWSDHALPLLDDKGRPCNWIGVCTDITKRKSMEKSLQESNERFKNLTDMLPEVIFETDKDIKITYANKKAFDFFGYSEDDLKKGLNGFDLLAPEDRNKAKANMAMRISGENPKSVEYQALKKDGSTSPVLFNAAPILKKNKMIGLIGVLIDITEHKQMGKELKKRTDDLSERIKELDCLYKTSQLLAESTMSEDEILQDFVDLIPPSWRYPDITCARIILPDREFKTKNFVDTKWKQSTDILVSGKKEGIFEVCYLKKVPVENKDSFPKEEMVLIDALARKLGNFCRQRHADDLLLESEKRYRDLFECASEGILVADSETKKFVYANPALCKMLGYSEEELQIMGVDDVHRKEDIDFVISEFEAQAKDEKALAQDIPFLKKDGTVVYANVSAAPVLIDGNKCNLGMITEMTAQRNAKERIRKLYARQEAILATVPEIIAEVDTNKVYTWLNRAGLDFFGEDALGKEASNYFVGEQKTYKAVQPAFEGLVDTITAESWQRRKDGKKRLLTWHYKSLRDDTGAVTGLLSSARDITKLRQIEEELSQTQRMDSIGQLAGGVAHDFNNLLMPILAYSEMAMSDMNPKEKLYEDLQVISESARRAADLTKQLLSFGRRQLLTMSVTNINSEIDQFSQMLKRIIGEDIKFTTCLQPDLGNIKADMNQIQQVLMNLASNARDAMPDGGKLTIETSNTTFDEEYANTHPKISTGNFVMFAVSDTGCGMNEDIKHNAFEPYFTTKEKGKGTGLGLATVYGIVKQHGGFIWIYSEIGKGTTFKIYMPRVDEALEHPVELSKDVLPLGEGETILLVEDDERVKNLTYDMLSSLNYKVLSTLFPTEALSIIDQHEGKIDLLLTDVIMPQMNGKQLYEKIVHSKPDLRVLYMSGYTENAIAHHGVLEDGINFLQKPFARKKLAQTLQKIFEKKI